MPSRFSIIRFFVPVLGFFALGVLFLKLHLGNCQSCGATTPFMPLLSAGYFALLVALSLLFPTFPSRRVAAGGTVWATLLALVLTYLHLPELCIPCLIAHFCHVLMWGIWLAIPAAGKKPKGTGFASRLCLVLVAPVAMMVVLAYPIKNAPSFSITQLKRGDRVPEVIAYLKSIGKDQAQKVVLNFVMPQCLYCKEQLPIVNAAASQFSNVKFINVSPVVSPELTQHAPLIEWMEDQGNTLNTLFKVTAYPVLFVLQPDGEIEEIFPSIYEQLEANLLKALRKIEPGI